MWYSIFTSIKNGDIYFIALISIAFLSILFFLQRFFLLQFVYNINYDKFIKQLKVLIKSSDTDKAIQFCRKTSNTGLPYIAEKAIETAVADPTMVGGIIDEEVIAFVPKLDKGSSFISMLGGLSILIGVIGSISSLWNYLFSMEVMDSTQKQLTLGLEMSASLMYTMFGLLVCIVCVMFSFYIKSSAFNISNKIYYGGSVLHNLYPNQNVMMGYMPATPSNEEEEVVSSDIEEELKGEEATTKVSSSDVEEFPEVDEIKDEEEII